MCLKYTKLNFQKILIYGAIVIFMSQINAMVDLVAHPEIPYLDSEHIIVGSVVGVFALAIGIVIYQIVRKLELEDKKRKKLINELYLAKEKAEESDNLKSAFLANMSHEIRTPMNGILGFTELLENTETTVEEQKKYLGIIRSSGNRLLNLINDIIDISKIEAGQIEINTSPVNIVEILKEILLFFKPEADKKGLQLICNFERLEDSVVIKTDREKVYAILVNLIKNAIKFTDQGSVEFGYNLIDTSIEFFIKDTGIGIPKHRRKDIFKRFVQADIKDKRASQGSGLGLAIANSYVTVLGGKITVESNPESGSTFIFTIPVKQF